MSNWVGVLIAVSITAGWISLSFDLERLGKIIRKWDK